MELKKKVLILIIIFLVFSLPQVFLGSPELSREITDYTALVPGRNVYTDQLFLLVVGPLIMVLLIFIFTIPLAYLLFKLHNLIKVRRYDYYIMRDFEGDISLVWIYIRCLFVSFLAFALGLIIYEAGLISPEVIIPEKLSVVVTDFDYVSMLALFIIPYIILIFAPIWLLKDSGIVCSKSNVNKENRETPDIEGVYRYYNTALTGYTGIGFVFTLIVLVIDRLEKLDPGAGELGDIPGIILTPFVLAFLVFPAIAFYEYRLKHMRTKLINKLEKKNIQTIETIKEIL
jgi:hypothetical protein